MTSCKSVLNYFVLSMKSLFFFKILKRCHFLLTGGKRCHFWLVFVYFDALYNKCRFAPLVKIRQKS